MIPDSPWTMVVIVLLSWLMSMVGAKDKGQGFRINMLFALWIAAGCLFKLAFVK